MINKFNLQYASILMCVLFNQTTATAQMLDTFNNALHDSSVFSSETNSARVQFGYTDAEAGFSGVHLLANYPYTSKVDAFAKATLLSGNGFNYQQLRLGASVVPKLPDVIPFAISTSAGLIYSSFDSDTEFGLLLGSSLHITINDRSFIEPGIELLTAGENSFNFMIQGQYSLSDNLAVNAKYIAGSLDELDIGLKYSF